MTSIGLGLAGLAIYAAFGSIAVALAYARGDSLIADRYSKPFEYHSDSSTGDLTFHLLNRTNAPRRILGAMASCNCLVVDHLPMTIAAREARPLKVKVLVDRARGSERQGVRLYTDAEGQPFLDLIITGQAR